MEIKFSSMKEIKEFILMVDIYQLCDKQESWKCHGYMISNRYFDTELNEVGKAITDPKESRVVRCGHFHCITTPYYKQLSWLFGVLEYFAEHHYNAMIQGKELDKTTLRYCFRACCELYFKKHPDHMAKELMIFVVDWLKMAHESNIREKYAW